MGKITPTPENHQDVSFLGTTTGGHCQCLCFL